MSARGLGGMLMFLGIMSFVLPFFGLQFTVINLFGDSQWIAGLAAIGIGLVMMLKRPE